MKKNGFGAHLVSLAVLFLVIFSCSLTGFTQEYRQYQLDLTYKPSQNLETPYGRKGSSWDCELGLQSGEVRDGDLDANLKPLAQKLNFTNGRISSIDVVQSVKGHIKIFQPLQSLKVRQLCTSRYRTGSGSNRRTRHDYVNVEYKCGFNPLQHAGTNCTYSETSYNDTGAHTVEDFLKHGQINLIVSNEIQGYSTLGSNCGHKAPDAILRIEGGLAPLTGENDFILNFETQGSNSLSLRSKNGRYNGDIFLCGNQRVKDTCLDIQLFGTETDLIYDDVYSSKKTKLCAGDRHKILTLTRSKILGSDVLSKFKIQRLH